MYCSNCGKQLEDRVRFCKYCGTATSHSEMSVPETVSESAAKQESDSIREVPATAESSKTKGRKSAVVPAVLIAVAVIAAGVFIVRSMSGSDEPAAVVNSGYRGDVNAAESNTKGNSYAIPELPDAIVITKHDDNYNYSNSLVAGQALVSIPDNCWDVQLADDGTLAMRINNAGVLIYRNGVYTGEIPGPVEYFYLSGSGEKIVYGTLDERNTWLWDVSTSESTLVSDEYRSWGISYNGSMIDMGSHYSKNGQKPKWADSPIGIMSPDGKYTYCRGYSYTTTDNDMKEYYASVSIMINGTSHTIFKDGPEPDLYYPYFIAYSDDYKEILFSVHDDIYYFSVEDIADIGFEAQRIGNIKGGQLMPLNKAVAYANIFSWDNYSDAVSAWRGDWYSGENDVPYRAQKTLQNGMFCLLKEQNGVKSGSIVRLAGNSLIELIPNVTGNIRLSNDESKLWCVADGKLVFCDLAVESPHPVYCDTAYVRAYDYSGAVGISGDMNYGEYEDYAMMTVPVVATSDGKIAYFVSVDGSLWRCTPDTVREPQYITNNAFWVQCSAENTIYLMKGDPWAYFNGTFCDLYQVGSDGEISYLYSNVVDMYMTKTDAYISVGGSSDDAPYYAVCAMYCISDGGYKFICDGYRAEDVEHIWWGNSN